MNDLDRLRDDLRADLDVPFGPPDLGAVMSTGRRIRRRRRLLTGSAAGLAVLAVTGVAVVLGRPAPDALPVVPPAAPGPSAVVSIPPEVTPPPPTSTPGTFDAQVVATGLQAGNGEFVIVVEPYSSSRLVEGDFVLRAGIRLPDGTVDPAILAHGAAGSPFQRGFHAVNAPVNVSGIDFPEFGYYSGPATRIVGRTPAGTTVEASLRKATPHDGMIIVFWFDRSVTGGEVINDLTAYDADGRLLPTGEHATPGHG